MVICNGAIKISLKIAFFSFLLNFIFSFNFSLDIVFLLSLNSFTSCRTDVAASSNLEYLKFMYMYVYLFVSIYAPCVCK